MRVRHATEHAANGQAALALLRRDPTKFFLVLLDVVMPVMDGVELLTLIKVRRFTHSSTCPLVSIRIREAFSCAMSLL